MVSIRGHTRDYNTIRGVAGWRSVYAADLPPMKVSGTRFDHASRQRALARSYGLSRGARGRLEWMLWYETIGEGNVRATCRHFGIAPKVFYYWRKRYDGRNSRSLEERSRRPHRVRRSTITGEQQDRTIALRKAHPRYSKTKLAILYREQYGTPISSWQIQKLMLRHSLYPNPKRAENTRKKRRRALQKRRITDLVTHPRPGFLMGIDTVVLNCNSKRLYMLTAIDRFSRFAYARAYTSHSSLAAADFLRRLRLLVGKQLVHIQTDNGSEFHLHFEKAIQELKLQHWWSRVRTPKDNAVCERFNRTMREEFLDAGNAHEDVDLLNTKLTDWLVEYNFRRPHMALGYRRPIEVACPADKALPMYS